MATTNIVIAPFGGSRSVTVRPLYQYDYGQILRFEGLELPQAYEVHFSDKPYSGEATTQIGNADGVTIPDAYLLASGYVYAWVFLHTGEDDGETRYTVKIPVAGRSKAIPAQPDPVQQDAITQAIAALNSAVEQTGQDAESAATSASAAQAAQAAAEEVAESIPEDYSELSEDVDDLKDALTLIDTVTDNDIGKALSPKTVTNGRVTEWQFKPISGGGGGTSDYGDLENKPQINSVTLAGNKSLADLGIASASKFNSLSIKENLLNSDIPGTTQIVVFDGNGNPTSITHIANNNTVRTDTFVWGTGTVTETRTLSDKYITLTTNLTTLETVISEILEVA